MASRAKAGIATGLVLLACGLGACGGPEPFVDLDALRAPPEGSERHGRFGGYLPCPPGLDACQRTKASLALHVFAGSDTPSAFVLELIHVGVGDERHVFRGAWQRVAGTPEDPGAVLVVLGNEAPQGYRRYLDRGDALVLLPAAGGFRLGRLE